MIEVKIKRHYNDRFIAYGGGGNKTLGQRSQEDLRKLAILAHQSNSKSLLEVFEVLPSLQDLQRANTQHKVSISKAQ